MKSLTKVTLLGTTCQEPVKSATNSGVPISHFTVITYKKKGGVYVSLYHDCKAFGDLANIILRFMRPTTKIYVEGDLDQDVRTTTSGQQYATTTIIVREISFLDAPVHKGSAYGDLDPELEQPQNVSHNPKNI